MRWAAGTHIRVKDHPNVCDSIRGLFGTVVNTEHGDWVKIRLDGGKGKKVYDLWTDMIEVDVLGALAKL